MTEEEPEPVVAEEEPEPVVEEIPGTEAENDEKVEAENDEPKKHRRPVIWTILIWILVALVVVVAAIAIIGRVAPEWLDYYLYSPEQLEILRGL